MPCSIARRTIGLSVLLVLAGCPETGHYTGASVRTFGADIARRAAMAAEKAVIKEVLEKVRWNRAEAARLLKISYKAMLYKIRQVGLDDRPERGSGRK